MSETSNDVALEEASDAIVREDATESAGEVFRFPLPANSLDLPGDDVRGRVDRPTPSIGQSTRHVHVER
jgi:hypothetical protein